MKVFDIVGGKVVINVNCLLIPELKAITENYPGRTINVFSYIYYLTDPDSPYENYPDDKIAGQLKKDFPGDYDPESQVIKDAVRKLKEVFIELPEDRLYMGAKKATDNLATYLQDKSGDVKEPKEAKSLAETLKMVDAVSQSLGSARNRRTTARAEVKARGAGRVAYDQQ